MFTLSFNFLGWGLSCLGISILMLVAQMIDSSIVKEIELLVLIGIAIFMYILL